MRRLSFLIGLLVALQLGASRNVFAGWAPVQVNAGQSYSVPVHTLRQMRFYWAFRRTVHQRYDFSCGSAAIATLLTYQYGRPTTEMAVFRAMYAVGNQAQIRREGFSLLDMKRYLQRLGYVADGVRVPLKTLIRVGIPAIALITDHGYRHFVVVKGADADQVLLGDPALGRRLMSRRAFERVRVRNLFFVIRNDLQLARFNLRADWATATPVPLFAGVDRHSMGLELLKIPSANRF